MDNKFYSVEEISKTLKMHEKTVQRYIREGKIKAVKVGKAWRVKESDLNAFLRENSSKIHEDLKTFDQETRENNRIKISSVIDIDVDSVDEAIRISNGITGSLNSKPDEYGKTSLSIQFLESERKLRMMFWGNLRITRILMEMLEGYIGK